MTSAYQNDRGSRLRDPGAVAMPLAGSAWRGWGKYLTAKVGRVLSDLGSYSAENGS